MALAKLVPRERVAAFVVTPETIVRWHLALGGAGGTRPDDPGGLPTGTDVSN
jgi:hypothetical protein